MKLTKRVKIIFSTLLIVAVWLSTVPMGAFTVHADSAEFAGGSGIADDPYLIKTKEHLNNVRNYLDAHYKLIANIEFTDADFAEDGVFYNDAKGWTPIGHLYGTPFTGYFDGNGFAIIDIYAKASNFHGSYSGVFGVNKGTITNLAVVGGNISDISSGHTYVGGVVGMNQGVVSYCYNTATVSSMTYGGGIAGCNNGTITNCYNAGNIINSQSYGGTIYGGIAGLNSGESTISLCYNSGHVTAHTSGGVVGDNNSQVTDCYFLENEEKGCGEGEGGTQRCSLEELKHETTFKEFDFETIWQIDNDFAYPFPTLQNVTHLISEYAENTTGFLVGNGSLMSPYLISDANQLINAQKYPDAYFKLVNDIVFSKSDNNNWVGLGLLARPFTGNFDGDGYSISGLTKCLFIRNKGTVKNVALLNATVSDTATLVQENYGTLSNCFSASNILLDSTEKLNVGGLVKHNYGTIINCFYQGEITASSSYSTGYIGGIVGTNEGTVACCYNIATIYSDKTVGGLAGVNSGTISDSYYYELVFNAVGSGENQGTKATVEQLKSKEFFAGFDFDSVWTIDNTADYPAPTLSNMRSKPALSDENNTQHFLGGSGELFNPYLISNKEQLENIAQYATDKKHFKLTDDITYNEEKDAVVIQLFNGVLDGDSHSIENFTFKSGSSDQTVGFIGENSGIIKNLSFKNCDITLSETSKFIIGTLAATNNGYIINVHVESDINIVNAQEFKNCTVGGIIGSGGGTIKNCSSMGEINMQCEQGLFSIYIGGIAGKSSATILDTVNMMDITVAKNPESGGVYRLYCGGIIGYSSLSTKERVCNKGNIIVNTDSADIGPRVFVGGIVGTEWKGFTAFSSNSGRICVNAYTIDSSAYLAVGGIVGATEISGDVKQSYNTGYISAKTKFGNIHVGGIAGETVDAIEDCYNVGNVKSQVDNSKFAPAVAGGIVGYGRNGAIAYQCYNLGQISADYVGGITGYNYGISHKNNYYICQTENGVGKGDTGNTHALTIGQLSDGANFSGFDFTSVWEINDKEYPYPTLRNVTHMNAEYITGDVNGDGAINNRDLGIAMQYINSWNIYINAEIFDINADGKVNNKDYGLLIRYVNGWDVVLQ